MEINWRQATEAPEVGRSIVVCDPHWKMRYPTSLIIGGYEVEEVNRRGPHYLDVRLGNLDDHGQGCYAVPWDEVEAWCYAEEFLPFLPAWLKWNGD